ncbi:MAG: hypothetical protein KDE47_11280, partial [Caldilineaceae bacterium]|nr:hypothetical protein [Caldilineaceae bacterium]
MGRSALRLAFAALLSLLLSSTASAQQSRHYNNWIFGNSCRVTWDANDNITVSSTLDGGGSIGFTTQEGSATWSDPATGALILYTDGIRVWNNLGEVVTDTNLKGNPSSLNSGIILPVPETPNQYFVIANPASSGAVMTITRFDFSQTKAGNTAPDKVLVAEKNITGTDSTSEAAQVALHSNKKDFWLISKDNTGIIVVPITKDGAGAVQRYEQGTNIKGNQYNGMRVNNSSTKIANLYINNVEIYDFDASTGVVSNRQSVGTHDTSDSYGAEFSPDDTKLYTSSSSSIYQFDLANSNARVNMFSGVTYPYIALGRDGKIYIPHYQQAFLHTITNPNAPAGGGATFNPDGLPLAQGCITTLGLPLALATNIAPPGV